MSVGGDLRHLQGWFRQKYSKQAEHEFDQNTTDSLAIRWRSAEKEILAGGAELRKKVRMQMMGIRRS